MTLYVCMFPRYSRIRPQRMGPILSSHLQKRRFTVKHSITLCGIFSPTFCIPTGIRQRKIIWCILRELNSRGAIRCINRLEACLQLLSQSESRDCNIDSGARTINHYLVVFRLICTNSISTLDNFIRVECNEVDVVTCIVPHTLLAPSICTLP